MPRRAALMAAQTILILWAHQALATAPLPVTPKAEAGGGVATMFTPCPTFHWVESPEARRYELVVFDAEASELYRVELPAGAQMWTPTIDRCFEPGLQYAWALRAVVDESTELWSDVVLFRVTRPGALTRGRRSDNEELPISPAPSESSGTQSPPPSSPLPTEGPGLLAPERQRVVSGEQTKTAGISISSAISVDDNLHATTGDTPTLRLEQDGSGSFTPQTWDIRANETDFRIVDVDADETRFRIDRSSGLVSGAFAIASDWITPSTYTGSDVFGVLNFRAVISAPEITQEVIDSGAVVVYGNLLSYAVGFWPPGEVAQLPITTVYVAGDIFYEDRWSYRLNPGSLEIHVTNNEDLYSTFPSGAEFRYVVIPPP